MIPAQIEAAFKANTTSVRVDWALCPGQAGPYNVKMPKVTTAGFEGSEGTIWQRDNVTKC